MKWQLWSALDLAPRAERGRAGRSALRAEHLLRPQLNFIPFAFVDILGLLPAAVGTLLLVARLFDGFNDPIMGAIADRTRTRWG